MRSPEAMVAQFNRRYQEFGRDGLTPHQVYLHLVHQRYTGKDIAVYFHVKEGTVSSWKRIFKLQNTLS